jgi:predicted permease
MERLRVLPSVDAVGACGSLPLDRRDQSEYLSRTDESDRQDYVAGCCFVSGDYFPALGIQLLRGRLLKESDWREGAPRVLVVDSCVAGDLFPNEDPIGQSLRLFGVSWGIVGVVAPVRHLTLDADPRSRVYGPERFPPQTIGMIIRTVVPPQTLAKAVQQTILTADPDQPIANVRTLSQAVHHSLGARRVTLTLLGLFAGVAVCLACVGIYGVVSYAISQRTCEFSIRSALGAQPCDIARLVLLESMKPAMVGIGIGLPVALALAHLLKSQLYGVAAYDLCVLIGSVCLLGMVAILSVCLPAYRAARIDPMEALRYE